ncbi:MAG TPA: hypothetical protein VN154_13000 [Rhizomicrobium sp.]|nr:hypothetical protein [Rhizomicrobium sp.]
MIRKKTVFVLGVGASVEVGMPAGQGLAQMIGARLDVRSSKHDSALLTAAATSIPDTHPAALLVAQGIGGSLDR